MTEPLVVEQVRSGFVESSHLVDVAVVDPAGRLVASAGDPERAAAFRSAAKPIQARVALEQGWEPPDDRALAVACASHNGEPAHVEQVEAILAAAGVGDHALRCPPDLPFEPSAVLAATERRRVYHNCSGKHAAMLATCAANGWPLETYRAPDHPHQRAVAARMTELLGGEAPVLVDGCGVPTFVAPLHALARAFLASDGGKEAAAMRAHPHLVGGTGRIDSDLMAAVPDVLMKSGAEGLACVAARGVGIAMKARDGSARYRGPAVMLVLGELGLLPGTAAALEHHRAPAVLGGGERVGSLRVRGTLARH